MKNFVLLVCLLVISPFAVNAHKWEVGSAQVVPVNNGSSGEVSNTEGPYCACPQPDVTGTISESLANAIKHCKSLLTKADSTKGNRSNILMCRFNCCVQENSK